MTTRRLLQATTAVLLLVSCRTEVDIPSGLPEARKDYAKTAVDTPVVLNPLANDHDPEGQVLDLIEIGLASHGTVVLNPDDSVTYTPNLGYQGGDSFPVWIRDSAGNRARGDAYVSIGDSMRMFFISNFVDFYVDQLYLVDLNLPGVAIPVNAWMPVTEGPNRPSVAVSSYSPNSAGSERVLYIADHFDANSKLNLFATELDQLGTSTQLTDMGDGEALLTSGGLPILSDDEVYVYYTSNEFTPEVTEIVRMERANPANKVRVNPPLIEGERITRWVVTPDSDYILYFFTATTTSVDPGSSGLYVVDASNLGVATKLSGTPSPGTAGVITLSGMQFVPGTDSVLFLGTFDGATTISLYMVDYVAQTAPVQVSGTPLFGGVESFAVSDDGTRVIYTSAEDEVDVVDLYTVEIANPGVSTRLSKARTDESGIVQYSFGDDQTYAVYLRDDDTDRMFELYRVDFANPTVQVKLNHTLGVDEDVLLFRSSTNTGRRLAYSATVGDGRKSQIHLVDVDTPGVTTDIFEPLPTRGTNYGWTPAGDSLVISADPRGRAITSVYLLELATPTVMTKLTPESDPGDEAQAFFFLP